MKRKVFDDGTTRKESFSFGYEKDALAEEGYREATPEDIFEMRQYIKECYRKYALTIYGSGGSGGSDGHSFNIRFNLTSCDAPDWN